MTRQLSRMQRKYIVRTRWAGRVLVAAACWGAFAVSGGWAFLLATAAGFGGGLLGLAVAWDD